MDNFDVSLFTYGTKLTAFNKIRRPFSLLGGFFNNRPKEDVKGFNVGIERISKDFEFEIRNVHSKYRTISVIAHSMGGLVTKSTLTWLNADIREKIHLFISLSVPHIGSFLAQIGASLMSLIGNHNPQIIGLKAMGEFVTNLSQRYADLYPQPKTFYQSGNLDDVVPELSAIPPGVPINDTARTSDTHFSVVLIKDRAQNSLYRAIIRELREALQPFIFVDAGVSVRFTFQRYLDDIAQQTGIRVSFVGFSKTELQTHLRDGHILANTPEDFFHKVADIADKTISKFNVENEPGTSNYILKVDI